MEGKEVDPVARYHANGFLSELDTKDYSTSWFSNGIIESQYSPPHNELTYPIQCDETGAMINLSVSKESLINYPLIQSKKFGQEATLTRKGVTDEFLRTISQWGAFQDTKKLRIRNCNISVGTLITPPLNQLELLILEDCPDIELKDIDALNKLYPNLRIDTEYL